MSKNNSTKPEEAKEFVININDHEKFNGLVETKYISSNELCKLVAEIFRSVYADFEGCRFEINQQGLPFISLFFNHSEPDEKDRVNGVTRTVQDKTGTLKNETVRRIRQHDTNNRVGDRYFLTEEGSSGIGKFIHDFYINKKDGKINWDKITAEVSQRQTYYGQPPVSLTQVSMLDPNKLVTEIYGSTDEEGNNIVYSVNLMKSVPQQVGMGLQAQFFLAIQKVSEKEVVALCNQLGVAPNQGLDIIR